MPKHRRARNSLYPILLIALAAGCQAFHVYRPVGVLVQDAETKKPIPTAEVYLTYPLSRDSVSPYNSSGVTREDGIARLRAAASGEHGVEFKAIAQGYLTEEIPMTLAEIQKIPPAHLFEETDKRPAAFVLEMYAAPLFTVEFVAPVGYRGLVKAVLDIQDDSPRTPGQRSFRYEVSSSGTVEMKGSSLLRRVSSMDYHARYVAGPLLSEEMDEKKVGFRWLKTEGKERYFVLGTQTDYDALRRRLLPEEEKKPHSSSEGGGKGGGHGGHHHHGGGGGGGSSGGGNSSNDSKDDYSSY